MFKARIISNNKIAPDHYVLSFKMPHAAGGVKPGQFFNIKVNDACAPLLRRPFGAHKINRNKIEILYKVVGKATEILAARKKGGKLDIIGPLGNGFTINPQTGKLANRQAIIVAGGHGVSPLIALAKKLSDYGARIAVFIGARTKNHVVCREDFKRLCAKLYVATEDGTAGYKGLITDLLTAKLKNILAHNTPTMYACGPKTMLKEIAGIAKRHRMHCQVSLEEYMACGIGTCLGCAVKTKTGYKLVCKDGPVFNAKDIVW